MSTSFNIKNIVIAQIILLAVLSNGSVRAQESKLPGLLPDGQAQRKPSKGLSADEDEAPTRGLELIEEDIPEPRGITLPPQSPHTSPSTVPNESVLEEKVEVDESINSFVDKMVKLLACPPSTVYNSKDELESNMLWYFKTDGLKALKNSYDYSNTPPGENQLRQMFSEKLKDYGFHSNDKTKLIFNFVDELSKVSTGILKHHHELDSNERKRVLKLGFQGQKTAPWHAGYMSLWGQDVSSGKITQDSQETSAFRKMFINVYKNGSYNPLTNPACTEGDKKVYDDKAVEKLKENAEKAQSEGRLDNFDASGAISNEIANAPVAQSEGVQQESQEEAGEPDAQHPPEAPPAQPGSTESVDGFVQAPDVGSFADSSQDEEPTFNSVPGIPNSASGNNPQTTVGQVPDKAKASSPVPTKVEEKKSKDELETELKKLEARMKDHAMANDVASVHEIPTLKEFESATLGSASEAYAKMLQERSELHKKLEKIRRQSNVIKNSDTRSEKPPKAKAPSPVAKVVPKLEKPTQYSMNLIAGYKKAYGLDGYKESVFLQEQFNKVFSDLKELGLPNISSLDSSKRVTEMKKRVDQLRTDPNKAALLDNFQKAHDVYRMAEQLHERVQGTLALQKDKKVDSRLKPVSYSIDEIAEAMWDEKSNPALRKEVEQTRKDLGI